MSDTYAQFEKRINSVTRRHKALAGGYTARITSDGLITLTPKPGRYYTRLRALAMMIVTLLVLKSVAIAAVGQGTYQSRVDMLVNGTAFEQLAAYIARPGPITTAVAQFLTSVAG